MVTKQVAVFIENRAGRLNEVSKILRDNDINIISFSLADTTDYGMFRMVVSDPENAKKVLRDADYTASITDVVTVNLPNEKGTLYNMLSVLAEGGVNVEYMYTSLGSEGAVVLKVQEPLKADSLLREKGFNC